MEVRLKTIRKPKMQTFSLNGFEWHGVQQTYTHTRSHTPTVSFLLHPQMNSKHFTSLTCKKASRICLFRWNQFEQFPCDRVCTKKFKTTSKNCFRWNSFFLAVLVSVATLSTPSGVCVGIQHIIWICWQKQLKLKNYTRRLLILIAHKSMWMPSSQNLLRTEDIERRISGIIVIISIQLLGKKSVQFTKINLFGNGKWIKVENRIWSWFECRLLVNCGCGLWRWQRLRCCVQINSHKF